MLSAFTARPIVELKARNKAKIESLVAYGDRLLVGLNTGVLRIYRVNEPQPDAAATIDTPAGGSGSGNNNNNNNNASAGAAASSSATVPTHLLREVERFAPRSIEQLAIIKEANTLVSLANYVVSLHDLQSFEPLPGAAPLPGTKNASSFAVTSNIVKDPATGIPEIVSRLAVAVKRRLLLWSWYASELSVGSAGGAGGNGGGPDNNNNNNNNNNNSSYTNGDDGSMAPAEITLSETIRSLTWASATKLVVGMNAGYVVVDVISHTVEEIVSGSPSGANGSGGGETSGVSAASRFGALGSAGMGYMGLGSYMPKPLAAKLADGEVLLAKDVHTLFITDTGKPLDRRSIPWPAAPESVGYSYPYILALQPPAKGTLEIRNPSTLSLLQTITLPNATQLHVPPPSVSLAHAGKGFHVSSERGIWKMDATAYDSQVDALVAQGHLDEAISLLDLLEDALLRNKSKTMRDIKMQKAERLFRQKKYLASMDLFNEEDVHAPPERVFRFFPRSIVGDLSDDVVSEEEPDTETDGDESKDGAATATKNGTEDGNRINVLSSVTTNGDSSHQTNGKNGSADGTKTAEVPQPEPASSLPLAGGFTKAFWGNRKGNSETASVSSAPKGSAGSDVASVKGKQATQGADADAKKPAVVHANGYVPLEGKELISAAEALNSYLAGTRARLQRVIDPATGKLKKPRGADFQRERESSVSPKGSDSDSDADDDAAREKRLRATFTLVDTTMFRVLMLIRPKLASSLFRIPNFCDPDVVNERLLEHNRFNELVDFFYGKRLHRPALELLKRFGDVNSQTDEDKNVYGGGDKETTADGTSDGTVTVPLALRGPQRTIAYLQSLPPDMIDLILEFSAWTLRADPANGMSVFLADSENAETLPRDRVVQFLAGIDARLEMQYLEHIITELNDLTPDFHNRLIEQRIKLLKEGKGKVEEAEDDKTTGSDGDGDGGKEDTWEAGMARLVSFLKDSRQYSLSRAFGLIPRDEPAFYEAQATVLSNMGQHKQALEIYVFKMKDYDKAEEYCNRVHLAQELAQPVPMSSPGPLLLSSNNSQARRTSSSRGREDNNKDDEPEKAAAPSIYHTLLSLYLAPPPPHERQLAPALDLLSRHGSRLPASSTLQLIPDTLPVAELASYFRGRMRAANSVVNESRIEKGLRQTAVLAAQANLLLGHGDGTGSGVPGGRNRRVTISEERACGVCHKRLGGSVVAVLPDNTVVHYGCLNRANRDGGNRAPVWR
ncbi:Vacuolar morphoproteinsis protein 6 [Sporothrix curviconia]|uniref:Vacuolar morphoproteinsis protein 6 n=1 Tax=Sporothrix curviconia TaxID=1260050 RepID=A0ABP0CGM1_9PEZI